MGKTVGGTNHKVVKTVFVVETSLILSRQNRFSVRGLGWVVRHQSLVGRDLQHIALDFGIDHNGKAADIRVFNVFQGS